MNETIDKVAEDAGFVNYYTPLTETYTTIAVNRDKLKEILKPEMLDMVKNTLHSIESTDPGIDKNLELLRANLRSMATEFQHVHDKLHCLAQTGQVYAGFILKHPPVQPNHLAILREVLDLLMSTLSLEMMDVSEMNMDISEAVEKVKRILSEYELSAATVEIQKSRIGTAADTLSSLSFKLNKSESRLKHLLSEVNKVPLIALFQRLQFLIEQVSKQLRKDIRLEYVGEEVQLDKTILEAFKDCLSHLVRNSCDHGIESQEERLSKNKHPYGTIHIGAVEENGMLQIRFRDDGRGINVEKLKNKLIAQKMFTAAQLQKMSREEIMRQILLPGVSTTDKVTEISGRGVGLDVLNHAVEKLNGHIEIYSEPDEYTEIAFNIPIL
ncbi:hypothetical protein CHS0354_027369 [Potamilus streckersoni]|uniref:histidine kinase n=1 Tax=Potamilus streckersoni TaxID=2493646 RepID=A0AAE0W003_9BIVA|nr:hypothetical protein CHS0354_027369 [Potamilus streckersoni]